MPTIQRREGDHIYWHASNGGRGVKAWMGRPVCLTVSILDGLVLASSGLHHSANYRSVMVFGQPDLIEGPGQNVIDSMAWLTPFIPGVARPCVR